MLFFMNILTAINTTIIGCQDFTVLHNYSRLLHYNNCQCVNYTYEIPNVTTCNKEE